MALASCRDRLRVAPLPATPGCADSKLDRGANRGWELGVKDGVDAALGVLLAVLLLLAPGSLEGMAVTVVVAEALLLPVTDLVLERVTEALTEALREREDGKGRKWKRREAWRGNKNSTNSRRG